VVRALCKSINPHGPGGRIEVRATDKPGKTLRESTHFLGNTSFDWKRVAFVFEAPDGATGLALGLGNRGTGRVLFGEIAFERLDDGAALPDEVLPRPRSESPKLIAAPRDALADYRMEEGSGQHVFDYAGGLGLLELANLDWVREDGRRALRFSDNATGRKEYPRAGVIDRGYFSHPAYKDRLTTPVAIAGFHGGGMSVEAFTLAAWIKPAAKMGKAEHGGKGDIVGFGARRVILRLVGQQAPYQLSACLNVNDSITSAVKLQADRWYHVAVTGAPTPEKKWRVRLYLDGRPIEEGVTQKCDAPLSLPPSLILGAELFYLHDAYYRGLIGRTLVFKRALAVDEIAELAGESAQERR
jgi:hypothetical protein